MDTKDRYQGCVVGLACGDALGYAVEFSSMAGIRATYGVKGITTLAEAALHGLPRCAKCGRLERAHDREAVVNSIDEQHAFVSEAVTPGSALYSDDTQMSLAVAKGLVLAGKGATCDSAAPLVAKEFVSWSRNPPGGHRAPGGACMRGCSALAHGIAWESAGGAGDGGCGSVMRAAPYGLYFWKDLKAAEECAARHSKMTHGHPLAAASAAALANGVWNATHGEQLKLHLVLGMRSAALVHDKVTADMLDEAYQRCAGVTGLARAQVHTDALARFRGWAGHECVAAAAVCFLLGESYEEVVIYGANSPGDSDSIACVAGALAGAYYGIGAISQSWLDVIERRDGLFHAANALFEASEAPVAQQEGAAA